jgi:hypothetical protein
MDFGFEIQGILRMDFLVRAGAVVDLNFAVFLNKGDVSGDMTILNVTLLAKIV